jgi:hypothetical protein
MNTYAQICDTYRTTKAQALAARVTVPYAWLMNAHVFASLVGQHPRERERAKMLSGRYLLIGRQRVPGVLDEATRDVYYLPIKQINSAQLRQHRTPPTEAQVMAEAAQWTS